MGDSWGIWNFVGGIAIRRKKRNQPKTIKNQKIGEKSENQNVSTENYLHRIKKETKPL